METPINTEFTDKPICPYCGHSERDAWEIDFGGMDGDVELLPLPELWKWDERGYLIAQPTMVDMQTYARANVLHHTAPLRYALDNAARSIKSLRGVMDSHAAEIEALRAEVAEARDGWHMANGTADLAMKHRDAAEARAERLAEEIDWVKFQSEDDSMFAEIEAAAKASFHRHRTSCRGQTMTRADNYESHLVWATLEWAKRTNGAEQRAERLAEALREARHYVDGNRFPSIVAKIDALLHPAAQTGGSDNDR